MLGLLGMCVTWHMSYSVLGLLLGTCGWGYSIAQAETLEEEAPIDIAQDGGRTNVQRNAMWPDGLFSQDAGKR